MVISASRRTDIPCCYPQWFINRIKDGFVLVKNPINPKMIYRVSLSPCVTDCIVFWTKDPSPMLPLLSELDIRGYTYYFQFTITPYDKNLEPYLREKFEIENTFIELSKLIGKDRVIWRYDPVILNEEVNIDYHKHHFSRMCEKLSSYTNQVTISFVDTYSKLKSTSIRAVTEHEIDILAPYFASVAKEHGLEIAACCENEKLADYGICKSSCIQKSLIEKLCDAKLDLPPDKNQRKGCGCFSSIDIGAYDTCVNGCVYCYANASLKRAKQRFASHDPFSSLLTGKLNATDVIIERNVISHKTGQMKLV